MYKNLPPYISINSKKAHEFGMELTFSIWVNNQQVLNRLAKLEAFLTKKPLEGVLDDIDKEGERIAAAGLKEIEAFYGD